MACALLLLVAFVWQPTLPPANNMQPPLHADHAPARAGNPQRNGVERLVNRLKQFRRVATHSEKQAANYLGMFTIAVILLESRALKTSPGPLTGIPKALAVEVRTA